MKRKVLLIIMILTFLATGCSTNKISEDSLKFKEDYESLNGVETATKGIYYRVIKIDKDNPIIYTTFKEVKEKINNKDSFVLYVGFASCPWCRSVIPYILEEAKENDIDEIYYINIREDNKKESDLRGYYKLNEDGNVIYDIYPDKYYHDVLNSLAEFLTPYTLTTDDNKVIETGEDRLYAPSLIAYKDGIAVALDECISDKQENGYQKLTDEIISEMKEKANKIFQTYKNKNCDGQDKSCK